MHLGVEIGPLYIYIVLFSFFYHLCLLHVSVILHLVTTHCCVCLVFCGWDGCGDRIVGWVCL